MSKATEEDVIQCFKDEAVCLEELEDALHCHFSSVSPIGWEQAGKEGQRIWNLCMRDEDDVDCPLTQLMKAVAAAGYDVAVKHVAKMLNLDVEAFDTLLWEWSVSDEKKSIACSKLGQAVRSLKRSIDKACEDIPKCH